MDDIFTKVVWSVSKNNEKVQSGSCFRASTPIKKSLKNIFIAVLNMQTKCREGIEMCVTIQECKFSAFRLHYFSSKFVLTEH